jgi:hypothetical protein
LEIYFKKPKMLKTRIIPLLIALILIPIGLATRQYGNEFLKFYAGDILWAAMIYWGFRFLLAHEPKRTAFYAIVFCFLIEFSQLYHAPWIDQIRQNRLGGLVLGFGFLWSDLVCYSVGIFLSIQTDLRLQI